MENDGRMGMRCIMQPEQAEHVQKGLATYRLMSVIEQRDAAIRERDNAVAEKKAAIAERDNAFYQRDLAITERNTAMMERDTALGALHAARGTHRVLGWNQYKRQPDVKGGDATMLQMSLPNVPFSVEGPPTFSNDSSVLGFINNSEKLMHIQSQQQQQQQLNGGPPAPKVKKETPAPKVKKERTETVAASNDELKPDLKRKHADNNGQMQDNIIAPLILPVVPYHGQEAEQQSQKNEMHPPMQEMKDLDYVINTPIPHCSCTGTPQPCYRWGNGGWQSACCTTKMSMHPLPMNPQKKGYRLPGRKMSAGAFQKLVKRLAQEGVDLSQSIDLKDYWAKHGTNRYVTIK